MSVAYLNDGATSLAAANWSDASGFVTGAELVIERGSQTIDTAMDYSGVTNGIVYLEVRPPFAGTIGSGTAPLRVQASVGTNPRVVYAATGGEFWLQAAGTSNTITTFEISMGSRGRARLIGGTITTSDLIDGESLYNASTVATDVNVSGGTHTFEDNGTAITNLRVFGGTVIVKRAVTNYVIVGGTVIVDTEGDSFGSSSGRQSGGTLVHVSGNIPNYTFERGVYDPSRLRRDATIGGTAVLAYPLAIGVNRRAGAGTLTWSNVTFRGTNAGESIYAGNFPTM